MKALGEASQAEAGVGKYASTGLDTALDAVKNTAVNVVKAETDRKNDLFKEFDKANKDVSAMAGGLGKGYYDSYKTEIDGLRGDLVAARTEEERADSRNYFTYNYNNSDMSTYKDFSEPFMIERGMPGAEYIPEKLRWNPVTYIKEVYFGGR